MRISETQSSVSNAIVDPADVDLAAYDLAVEDHRIAAFVAFSHQGEESLLKFTAHVWDSLNDPADWRAALMAQKLGLDGSGKIAVANVLRSFLRTNYRALEDLGPIPKYEDYMDDFQRYSEVMLALAERMDTVTYAQAQVWAQILNGGDPGLQAEADGTVIVGPWCVDAR